MNKENVSVMTFAELINEAVTSYPQIFDYHLRENGVYGDVPTTVALDVDERGEEIDERLREDFYEAFNHFTMLRNALNTGESYECSAVHVSHYSALDAETGQPITDEEIPTLLEASMDDYEGVELLTDEMEW